MDCALFTGITERSSINPYDSLIAMRRAISISRDANRIYKLLLCQHNYGSRESVRKNFMRDAKQFVASRANK